MRVAIIDYGAGNTFSVQSALQRLGAETFLSADAESIKSADKVIFPGQGEASTAMRNLIKLSLDRLIKDLLQPFLGICLGLQLLCESTEEGDTKGLAVFKTKVLKFRKAKKVPHMGWNSIECLKGPLFEGLLDGSDAYFVHSYYAEKSSESTALSSYGEVNFASALQKDNFHALQFHPEKSQRTGEIILRNFLAL